MGKTYRPGSRHTEPSLTTFCLLFYFSVFRSCWLVSGNVQVQFMVHRSTAHDVSFTLSLFRLSIMLACEWKRTGPVHGTQNHRSRCVLKSFASAASDNPIFVACPEK